MSRPPASQIAFTDYDIHIQPGIRYAPHPAFALDAQGRPRYLALPAADKAAHPLLVFLPGTAGKPENASRFIRAAAAGGYRAISLAYNDTPAVVQACHSDPDPKCSERFREERVYGRDVSSKIDDTPAESIVSRLGALLAHLARRDPAGGAVSAGGTSTCSPAVLTATSHEPGSCTANVSGSHHMLTIT